jgi:hypothetical protein
LEIKIAGKKIFKSRLNLGHACYHPVPPAILCGCETRYLTLKEAHRLRMFENRALRRISGTKRYEVTGEWRKL